MENSESTTCSNTCCDVIQFAVHIAMVVIGVQVSDENKIKMKYE